MIQHDAGADLAALAYCVAEVQRADAGSAWLQHTPFALFLVHALRPRVLVELGTYSGTSYCAFCQAISTLEVPCKAYAVDTWEGDDHCGPYSGDILVDLMRYHHPRYASFSTLLKSTFDAALAQFPAGTVDLLHIDGCHAYEAVAHDFQSWLPKLSNRAVVLFHDTQVRNFGVWQLWEVLQQQYPSFEFHHGYGLGVLGVGRELPPALHRLFDTAPSSTEMYRMLFRQLGQRVQAVAADRAAVAAYQQQLAQVKQTWTWRVGRAITAPVRAALRRAA